MMQHGDEWSSIGRTPTDAILAQSGYDLTAEYRDVLQRAGLDAGRTVLELATGSGRTIAVLTRLGHRVMTGDRTLEQLPAARARVGAAHLNSVRFLVLSMECLPFRDGTVAAVVSINTVHELQRPALCLGEMVRVLAPGGRLVVADFNEAGFLALQQVHQTLHGRDHPRGTLPMSALRAMLAAKRFALRILDTPLLTACVAVRTSPPPPDR